MKRIRKLIGEKISLSLILIEDIPKIVEWANDFATSDGNGNTDLVASYNSVHENIEENLRKDRPVFVIIKNNTNELIGYCSIFNTNHLHKTANITITIDKLFHREGYEEESIRLLLDYTFNYLNLYNIMLTAYSYDLVAIRCYEKVGFKKFGERTNSRYINGKWYNEIYMEILKDDFNGDYIRNKINYH